MWHPARVASPAHLRPGALVRRVLNPIVLGAGGTGLAVRGRRSGRVRVVPVNVLEHGGERYLVSPRGRTEWVRNLRAAGEGELRRRGRRERFRAEEVPVEERPELIAAYRARWDRQAALEGRDALLEQRPELIAAYRARWDRQVGRLFDRLPDPADHPVFRVRPAEPGSGPR